MSIFYKSERIGKGGVPFTMLKFRSLREGSDKDSFASEEKYVPFGRFMRKFRIDELPQIWNMLRGDMAVVGPRPEELRTINVLPPHIKEKLLSVRPGLFGLSGIYFMDEEVMLQQSNNPASDFWMKIKPMKMTLDFFYIDNKCLSLDLWIIYQAIKVRIKTAWTTQ